MVVSFRDLVRSLHSLEIERTHPVIAHASLSAFGKVAGGADTLLGALLFTYETLIMPTFTYKTMLIPETGPAGNAMVYGSGKERNCRAEFFRPDMPADRLMGIVPEVLRHYPKASRSSHPILSFTGINADRALRAQAIQEPLAPIRVLWEARGWVLLLGVDQRVNTSIHLGERLAGRKQFVRWALTPRGVQESPGFPGCSEGFEAIAPRIEASIRRVRVGKALVQAMPLAELVETARAWVLADPSALLCDHAYCDRCEALRKGIAGKSGPGGKLSPEG